MIKIESMTKSFEQSDIETVALNKINLHIAKGEFVAVMGPSGCGKSTLLNILGLLDVPSSGDYILNNTSVISYNDLQRTKMRKGNIGFIFQNFNLIDELNVYKNVELPLKYMNVKPIIRDQKVTELLKTMNINHRAKYYPFQLSGGQQQLVAVARAIITNPSIILADEPTGNLDSENGAMIMDLFTKLNESGITIIMATHSKRDSSYAHRIINLYDGSIVSSIDNM